MVDIINLFKKRSSIWVLVVIAFIVLVGAFVITNEKSPDDKTNKVSANANTANNTTSNTNSLSNSNIASNTSSSSNQSTTTNNTSKSVDANSSNTSQKYISNNLGFSITFPASWKNKYNVVEDNNGLAVYFKPASHPLDPVVGGGLLFRIVKKTPNLDEGSLDTINGTKRYFTAKGTTFVIGGPTDVNFPENNPEFSTYRKLSSECSSVINTIEIN